MQGDGGGPLVCQIEGTNRYQEVGIISWGIGCAEQIPGLYTDVAHFRDWIDNEIKKLNYRQEYNFQANYFD